MYFIAPIAKFRKFEFSIRIVVRNILVVYYFTEPALRASQRDHLRAFGKYSGARCFYLNLAVLEVPRYLHFVHFDLIVYHWFFLGARWTREVGQHALQQAQALKAIPAVKIALPQDECLNSDWLCDFIGEFEIDLVFSVAQPSEWPVIYPNVDPEKTKFFQVLTGYLEEGTIARIDGMARETTGRPIDIGYRTAYFPMFGRQNMLKLQLGQVFAEQAPARGFKTDISSRQEDFFVGDEWYRFLLQCRYTLGVEGGASLMDRDGTLYEQSRQYLERHPDAGFEELEAACFPERDGNLNLRAISPRQLEACATRTCQILIEGDYNGVLQPGRHYIELKRDFSNLAQVLELMRQDTCRHTITETAYREIVASGRYTYKSFVEFLLEQSLGVGDYQSQPVPLLGKLSNRLLYFWMRVMDRASSVLVALLNLGRSKRIKRIVPPQMIARLRRAYYKS